MPRVAHAAVAAGGSCLHPKWYLVKTKALCENRVSLRLTGAGYEVLFPKISRKSKRSRGLFEMRPLFPTYLFVRFHGDELKTIKYTHGVARVICFGLEPHEVDEEIIEAVRARMNEEGIVTLEPKAVTFSPGQRVKIGEGPFAGLDAIFLEEMPDRERVVLLLDAVSSFKLTIEKDSLER
jgi:transcriptional antiterminator RfaH